MIENHKGIYNNMATEFDKIERNPEVINIIKMLAETSKIFKKFASTINDEDVEELLNEVKDALDSCISNMSTIENSIYTADVLNYTEGLTISAIDQMMAGR